MISNPAEVCWEHINVGKYDLIIDSIKYVPHEPLTIIGRSSTSLLIDSAAEPISFPSKTTILDIATKLVKPFDYKVKSDLSEMKNPDWKTSSSWSIELNSGGWTVDPGEKVFEALERLTKKHGIFLKEKENKVVSFIKYPSGNEITLDERSPIKELTVTYDGTQIYGKYIIKCSSSDDDAEENKMYRKPVVKEQ